MTNPVLGFAELAAAQANPHNTVNAAHRALARAVAGAVTVNLTSDADYALACDSGNQAADEWPYGTIAVTDTGAVLTAPRSIVYPDVDAEYGGPSRMLFVFRNQTAQDLTVKRSGQAGVTVAAGDDALLYHNGLDVVAVVNPLP